MPDMSRVGRLLADASARAASASKAHFGIGDLADLLEHQFSLRRGDAAADRPSVDSKYVSEPRGINRLFFGRVPPDPMALPLAMPIEDGGAEDTGGRMAPGHEDWAPVLEGLEAICQGHEALLGILDMTCVGMFIFDIDAHLVFANRYGEDMLAEGGDLQIGGGKLSASRPDNVARISHLFGRMASADVQSVGMTRIERQGGSAYVMVLTRCLLGRNEALVALVSDPDQRVTVAGDMLRELYGLGRAEAEIAVALAKGLDLEAIAELRVTSIGTVRNQVKSIAAKMDCTRQIDIVRRILSIPIICPPRETEKS
ncbi:hypothetical protein [uncultured Sphingobium sp.]|uniref:helix-turn-helix transcriptional regulator n=1 Tax=uncultured Sphingobium sp. TaxID=316087 RepID=UPI002610E71B|nr:hypothetical protein [uncultured Sphingobium sp.]